MEKFYNDKNSLGTKTLKTLINAKTSSAKTYHLRF